MDSATLYKELDAGKKCREAAKAACRSPYEIGCKEPSPPKPYKAPDPVWSWLILTVFFVTCVLGGLGLPLLYN